MSMFNKAKTIAPAPKAKFAKQKAEVEMAGIEHLAMIDTLQKTLETVRGTLESEVKSAAAERFVAHIQATGQKPDNFTGIEGNAFASLQFRRKSSAYALSAETVSLLRENGIEPHKEVTTPALFAINPAYAADQDLLAKVEKALAKIVPDDFIVMQEEQSKLVATEETLNTAISKRCDAGVIASLTTISCGLKLRKTDMQSILHFVEGLLDTPAIEVSEETATALKNSAKRLRVVA